MPRAALPQYLLDHAKDFKNASPGLRFGAYLPIWTDRSDQEAAIRDAAQRRSDEGRKLNEILTRQGMDAAISFMENRNERFDRLWCKSTSAATAAWREVIKLSGSDKDLNGSLVKRILAMQNLLGSHGQAVCAFDAIAIAPFTTGLGNEHPLENGFTFLNPYGLPCLPGSGVKGVLRAAAGELASGDWGGNEGWTLDPHEVRWRDGKGKQHTRQITTIDLLFGSEVEDEQALFRGVLSFWDVLPAIEGNSLLVEVMTPHQNHYYQQDANPHDSGQPNPIQFLTVPPGSRFSFTVLCDTARLHRLAPDLADRWQGLLQAAFNHAFQWLGFGAKTAVGYGAMAVDPAADQRREDVRKQLEADAEKARRDQARAAMSEQRQQVETFIDYMQKRVEALRGSKANPNGAEHIKARELAKVATHADWGAEDRKHAAEAIETWLPQVVRVDMKEERKKLGLKQLREGG